MATATFCKMSFKKKKRDKNTKSYSFGSTYYYVLSNVKVLSRKLICVVDGCNVLITYSVNELLNTTKHKLNISTLVLKGQIFQEN